MWCVIVFFFDFLNVLNGGIDVFVICGFCVDIE